MAVPRRLPGNRTDSHVKPQGQLSTLRSLANATSISERASNAVRYGRGGFAHFARLLLSHVIAWRFVFVSHSSKLLYDVLADAAVASVGPGYAAGLFLYFPLGATLFPGLRNARRLDPPWQCELMTPSLHA